MLRWTWGTIRWALMEILGTSRFRGDLIMFDEGAGHRSVCDDAREWELR